MKVLMEQPGEDPFSLSQTDLILNKDLDRMRDLLDMVKGVLNIGDDELAHPRGILSSFLHEQLHGVIEEIVECQGEDEDKSSQEENAVPKRESPDVQNCIVVM